ncbi:MAG: nitrophenyl compound nitroreductase subunit ArsF family protein [Candidatus Omnitrophota bacterium]
MLKTLTGFCIAMILLAGAVDAQQVVRTAQGLVEPMPMQSQLVVYYFHGNARCPSCYKLEQYAKEALEQNFADELKSGKIVFKIVNIDKSVNDHFVTDYQLYTKSIVLSLVKDGKQVRYKNLDKVWDYLRDQKLYHAYVRDEVKPFIGEL